MLVCLSLAWMGLSCSVLAESAARIWEETIVLPTYQVAPPDPNPRFYSGRTYQGAKATFYPYPVSDQMTEKRAEQKYNAVYLENDYIKISVLPEIGGRIFTALDKGNHYDFFYRQHVIKPALIGMLGAWISGGVEWNIPHHHRASSFMPVDYKLMHNKDGSKTLWVGETELRHRTRWMVGLTLRPDRSYIEMTVKVFNRTPEAQSFLFWINPAVHANENYQVLFPPSVEWAVQHSKPEFAGWPIAHENYGGNDYTRGVDISWWKNHPTPVSFFAWDCREDFFGGYDHGKKAGVVQISNHHVSPGKKFFEWGNGFEGEMWTKILSDEDGPYLELMSGSYSDNQPDYSWNQPHETKVFTHYWYPIRELGGLKNANVDAAMNLEVTNGTARVAFNTTASHSKATALVKSGGQVLLNQAIRISPREPFATSFPIPAGADASKICATLTDQSGRELISYQPKPPANTPMPKPVKRPAPPKDIQSNEELFLTGLRIEQLYSPSFDPMPYYLEALKRDAGDYRANTALGALYCRQGRYAEAEPLLQAAVDRVTENYIRSKDCEAQYYLAVALRSQGKTDAARDAFWRAIWVAAWQPASYCALAEMACADRNLGQALSLAERALAAGALNSRALEVKLSVLRHLGRSAEASQTAKKLLETDPLNPRALFEEALLAAKGRPLAAKKSKPFVEAMRGETSSYLELAIDYAGAGLWSEAIQVLNVFVEQARDPARINPLVYYYRAYFRKQTGELDAAGADLRLAAQMPPDFCFPFQHEAERILRDAIARNPGDAHAQYYLGNLLFDNQPLKAIEAWEKAVALEASFALAQRNLGLARAQSQKDVPGAIPCLEKAVSLAPADPRYYYELDVLYEANGTPVEKRLALLNGRKDIVALRDDAATRRISLLIATGQTEEALRILRERHFRNWEGSSSLHDIYVDACLRHGMGQLRANQTAQALQTFQAAQEFPANQEVGRVRRDSRGPEISYFIGLAQSALGKEADAKAAFERASRGRDGTPSEAQYFKALALQKLGKSEEAKTIFEGLIKHGEEELNRQSEAVDYFAKFGERRAERLRLAQAQYLAGLGELGLGREDAARAHLTKALELHPAHLGALTWNPK